MALIYNSEKFDSSLNTYRETFGNIDNISTTENNEQQYDASIIIPLDFSLEMDGISGIIPNSAFEIPTNILPKMYLTKKGESRIAFILHTVDHNFNNNKWTTKITGQTLNIRFDELSDEEKLTRKKQQESLNKIITDTLRSTPYTLTSTIEQNGLPYTFKGAPLKGNPLLKNVLQQAGYKPGTFVFEMALIIGTKEGWLPKVNGGIGSRAYRNNNPGNLDYSNSLKNIDPKVIIEPGGRFARFSTAELGAKALIENKIKRWGNGNMPITTGNQTLISPLSRWKKGTPPTLEQFMYTYAPPNENNTELYIQNVLTSLQKNYPKLTRNSLIKTFL